MVERVHVVDNVSTPYTLATRGYFAELFERCFPTSEQMVGRMQCDLLSDPGSLTRYSYWGMIRYREIPGAEIPWGLELLSEEAERETGVDLVLKASNSDDNSNRIIQVHVFTNWGDFCKAYRGPRTSPTQASN
jgi:hypothetical protein